MVEEKAVDIILDLILVLVWENIVLNSVSIACRFPIKIFSSWRGAYIDTFTVSFCVYIITYYHESFTDNANTEILFIT